MSECTFERVFGCLVEQYSLAKSIFERICHRVAVNPAAL